MSANTAIHMVAKPRKVTARKIALMTNAKAMFCFRMLEVCRELERLESENGGAVASTATEVEDEPFDPDEI